MLQLYVTLQVPVSVFTAQDLAVNLTAFLSSPPQPPPGGERRLLRVVIRVADIMKVIVITANVQKESRHCSFICQQGPAFGTHGDGPDSVIFANLTLIQASR